MDGSDAEPAGSPLTSPLHERHVALGAKFVWVGRPFNYAASVAGEPGVAHAIQILKGEVRRNMALLGVTSPGQVGPSYLRKLVSDTFISK